MAPAGRGHADDAEGNKAIGEALSDVVRPTPLMDLGIFLVALFGFAVFYGLKRLADRRHRAAPVHAVSRSSGGAGSPEGGTATEHDRDPGTEPSRGVYLLHLSSFMVYNAPSTRRSSFGWFLTGLTLYAALLTLVTALSE